MSKFAEEKCVHAGAGRSLTGGALTRYQMTVMTKSRSDRSEPGRSAPAVDLPDEGLIVMDLSLKPVAVDAGAAAILKASNGRCDNGNLLPAEILHKLSSLTADDLSSFKGHFRLGKRDYACRSYLIHPKPGAFAPSMVALHLHRDASVSDAITGVAFLYSLTLREQEALSKISMGLTSKEVAEQMKISPNTVKAFLRSIMLKMGVTTRAGLVGKVLEHQNHDR